LVNNFKFSILSDKELEIAADNFLDNHAVVGHTLHDMMVLFYKHMSVESNKINPELSFNNPKGFTVDLREHRLGSTKGRGVLLLHPDDYKNLIPLDENV